MSVNQRQHSEVESDDDEEDWNIEVLQALVRPSTAEDAALACAAAWMKFVGAERVSVAVFDSTTSCIVAHGQIEDSHLTIYVGRESSRFSSLLQPEQLYGESGPCQIENPNLILCWPEHFSVVLVRLDEDAVDEERIDLIQDLSRQLLARWTTPNTSFANPAHMEAMAEFAAGAGHEINNPLGSIIGQTQLLMKRETKADHVQALETIGSQAWRIRDMIGDTMLFARPAQPEFTDVDLREVCLQVVANVETGSERVTLRNFPMSLRTHGDEAQIATLLSHLIRNACEATEEIDDGLVVVESQIESDFAVVISVSDNGPEISDEIRRHLFDPFFSGRQAGRGLGFGLCHCWQIVRMHNGLLTHESLPDGNRFVVVLPLDSASTAE